MYNSFPRYQQNVQKYSSMLRSQPLQPMDLAMYWVEHVLKFKGASHLKNAGVKLKWYQAYLLDVFVCIATIIVIICYVNFILLKKLVQFLKRKFTAASRKIKKQ